LAMLIGVMGFEPWTGLGAEGFEDEEQV